MSKRVVRYSEAFKMQVVSELESGALDGIEAARRRYGIAGGSTVQGWLKKYGRDHLRTRVVRVETPNERDQVEALKKRVKQLEKALADTQVDAVLNKAFYQIVCREHGIEDPEAYKKKNSTRSCRIGAGSGAGLPGGERQFALPRRGHEYAELVQRQDMKNTALAWGEPRVAVGQINVGNWAKAPDAFYAGALFTWYGLADPVGESLIEAAGPGLSLRIRVATVPVGEDAAGQGADGGLAVCIDPGRLTPHHTNAVFLTWHRDRFVTLYVNGALVDFWPVKGPMRGVGEMVVKAAVVEGRPTPIRWFCLGPGLPTFAERYRLHVLWRSRCEMPLDVYPVHQPYGIVLEDPEATLRDPSEVILVDGRRHVYFTRVTGTVHGFTGSVWASSCAEGDDPFDPASWSTPVEVIPKGEAGRDPDGTGCFTPDCFYDGKRVFVFYTALDSTAPNGYPSASAPLCPEHILVAKSARGGGPFVKTPKHSPHTDTERRLGYDEATIPGGHTEFEGRELFDFSLIDHGQCWVMPDGERRYYYKGGGPRGGGAVSVMRDFDEHWLNGRRISSEPLLWVGRHMENILITRVDDTLWLQHIVRQKDPVTGKTSWEWLHSWTSPADDGLNWRHIGGGIPEVDSRHSLSHGVAETVNPTWGIGQMNVAPDRVGLAAMKVV